MYKTLLLAITFLSCGLIIAQQELSLELDSITTIERAEKFVSIKRNRANKIITFNEEKHKTKLSKELLDMGSGATKVIEKEFEIIKYKVIERNKIPYYRVHYILLDGSQAPISEINKLRPQLITMLENGIPFKDLALQYSMDTNKRQGGDSGWITHGDMLPEFETQVMNDKHDIDDVFTVDVESNKWYYVVKKSYPIKEITEVKVLKVVEPRQ